MILSKNMFWKNDFFQRIEFLNNFKIKQYYFTNFPLVLCFQPTHSKPTTRALVAGSLGPHQYQSIPVIYYKSWIPKLENVHYSDLCPFLEA